ncbi:MAG: hypothetical protein RIM99_18235 [Cyclobacteriaceae bacterium]
MSLFSKILGKKSEFTLRYNKAETQWQVYREKQLLYVGTKQLCERFIQNSMQLS